MMYYILFFTESTSHLLINLLNIENHHGFRYSTTSLVAAWYSIFWKHGETSTVGHFW